MRLSIKNNTCFQSIAGLLFLSILSFSTSCSTTSEKGDSEENATKTAEEILGNPDYLAISYGGYREATRDIQPTVEELKDDLKLMSAMGIRIIRTYNVHLPQAENVLKAIREMKTEDPTFEMYVMLGAWIDCKNAWTDQEPDHTAESERNEIEIAKAIELVKEYPGIIKVLAVGNESMVHWAAAYFVEPEVILKYVKRLQDLKEKGELPKDLWITSSDNFASWGGGDSSYHKPALMELIEAVDYISMHTYPFLDTHYNPTGFWDEVASDSTLLQTQEGVVSLMEQAGKHAVLEYNQVKSYVESLGIDKPIHIGETGWATASNTFFGTSGSSAADEYKQALYYAFIRNWSKENNVSCFYFEAFDEPWKDAANPGGEENYFGLFTLDGQAKFPLWEHVDQGDFQGLSRNGNKITKTYDGDQDSLINTALSRSFKE